MNYQNEVLRSFATIREMLKDRGVNTESLETVSGADLLAIAGSKSVFSLDLPSCDTRIVYNLYPKFKLSDVRKALEEEGLKVVIVVVANRPTHAARKGVDELKDRDVQFFDLTELQYNVSRHALVPLHEPIRAEADIEAVVTRYRLKSRYHLPLILSNDAMARYLALKPGQVVRITRPSPSAGTYVLYRCCTRA